jgi:methionyl aminopeptidase
MTRVFVPIRTEEELDLMRKSGQITAKALKKVLQNVKPGVSLVELDQIADDEMRRLGAGASFKTVPGYYWATCLTVNDEVVHGIPRDIILKEGDLLGVDLGAVYKGWHTDAAWSVLVGKQEDKEKLRFLRVGEEALWKAVGQAVQGRQIGDISAAIQETIEGAGYSVVKSLAGHGVGRQPHEEPEVPTYGKKGAGQGLQAGMTIAIEAIYAQGKGDVYEKDDGWTIATWDKSLGGLFEMSVIVNKGKAEVLTDWRKV